jgi:2-iminobutanoate/2-iminopropanoate deaminase
VHPDFVFQSQAIKAAGFVFLAGQVPTDSQAKVVPGTITEKAHKMCQNTQTVLEAAGSSLEKVVKVTVSNFASLNIVYIMNTSPIEKEGK